MKKAETNRPQKGPSLSEQLRNCASGWWNGSQQLHSVDFISAIKTGVDSVPMSAAVGGARGAIIGSFAGGVGAAPGAAAGAAKGGAGGLMTGALKSALMQTCGVK